MMEGSPKTKKATSQTETEKKEGLALLIYDLKQRKLIPIKILSLTVLSGFGVLFPYITNHMKSLGISVEETGTLLGVGSVIGIFTPFAMGMIADKLGNFKVMLSIIYALTGTCALLFLLIPVGRLLIIYPANISLAVRCDASETTPDFTSAKLVLADLDSNPCDFQLNENSVDNVSNVSITSEMCGYICYDKNGSEEVNNTTMSHNQSFSLPEVPSFEIVPLPNPLERKFRDAVFFPYDEWSLHMSCSSSHGGTESCTLHQKRSDNGIIDGSTMTNVTFGLHVANKTTNKGIFPVKWLNFIEEDRIDNFHILDNLHCGSYGEELGEGLNPLQLIDDLKEFNFTDRINRSVYQVCRVQCIVQIQRSDVCSNEAYEKVFQPQLTFWLYMLLRFTVDALLSGSAMLFDGASLALVNEVGGDFGFQKMFGFIGIAIFSPISGALIDYVSNGESVSDYRPIFFLFAGLMATAAVGVLTLDLDFKPPAKELLKNIKSLFKNVEFDVLMLLALVIGVFFGCVGSYLFLFLEEIGGTKSLIGLSVMVSCLSGIPLLLLSNIIFRKFSHPTVIVSCFAVYVIRLIGYSYISDPRICIIYESLGAITTSLTMVSIMTRSAQLGTTSTLASIQGSLSASFGIGTGTGSLIGSFLIRKYGQRVTFRIIGITAFVIGIAYMFFNILHLRHKNGGDKAQNMPDLKVDKTVEDN